MMIDETRERCYFTYRSGIILTALSGSQLIRIKPKYIHYILTCFTII